MKAANNPGLPARIGILTVSDRASQGVYEDKGGPAIRDWLTRALAALPRVAPSERMVDNW